MSDDTEVVEAPSDEGLALAQAEKCLDSIEESLDRGGQYTTARVKRLITDYRNGKPLVVVGPRRDGVSEGAAQKAARDAEAAAERPAPVAAAPEPGFFEDADELDKVIEDAQPDPDVIEAAEAEETKSTTAEIDEAIESAEEPS